MYTRAHTHNTYVLLYIYRFHHIFDSRPNASHFLECLPLRYMCTVVVSYYTNKPFFQIRCKVMKQYRGEGRGEIVVIIHFFKHTLDGLQRYYYTCVRSVRTVFYDILTGCACIIILHGKTNTFDVCVFRKTR